MHLRIIAQRDAPNYRYDPRTRPWYKAGRDRTHTTPPYVFFTAKELGVTVSRRAAAGSVFGVDLDLAGISTQLAALLPTPLSMAAIVQPGGAVLAFSDPTAFARLLHGASDAKVPMVGDLDAPQIAAALQSRSTGTTGQNTFTDSAGRSWLTSVSSVSGSGVLGLIVFAASEDELLAPAARVS